MEIVFDAWTCTGCRACEIACSFHHYRMFVPERASLKVHRDEGSTVTALTVYEDHAKAEQENRAACDGCRGEGVPLCVKYCAPRAITVAEENGRQA